MKTKKCTACGEVKTIDEFYKSKNGRNLHGVTYSCKDCQRKKANETYHANKCQHDNVEKISAKLCRDCGRIVYGVSVYKKVGK